MKAADWIDRVKTAHGWDSDYRVSKELGLSRQAVSDYRVGRSLMDEDAALKVAHALGEAPEIILIDQAAERMKTPEARTALSAALKRLGGVAAGLVVAVGVVSGPSQAEARTAYPSSAGDGSSVYYVKSRRKRRSVMDAIRDTLAGNVANTPLFA